MTDDLTTRILKLGERLVVCELSCADIVCDRSSGQIPRCLIIEETSRAGDTRGAAVIGLNPGSSSDEERQYYMDRNCTYASVVSWSCESGCKRGLDSRYYRRLRELIDALNLTGPILWTELAKCESKRGVVELPLQTFRTCTDKFLQYEIESLPVNWPLFAVGKEAYRGLAYRFPARTVIGVPHPTGSRGQFHALFENSKLRESVLRKIEAVLSATGQTVWISHPVPNSHTV